MQTKNELERATLANEMNELFQEVRARTMRIVEPLEIEDYVVQTAPFMSPPRWHIGHTSWFFELLLKDHLPGYEIYSEEYLFYFNSYYERFGTRIDRDKRGTRSRPTVKDTRAYRKRIDEAMLELLTRAQDNPKADELSLLVMLGLEHEMQHQELLVYDIKHLLCDLYEPTSRGARPLRDKVSGMAEVEGGLFMLGHSGDDFAFDNEKPAHQIYVQDFAIDRVPVTSGEYLEFIRAGGYGDFRWWFAEAWDCIHREGWQAPLYWELHGGEWMIRDFAGLHKAEEKADEPVTHVSFYEASAFAKWAGKRLPTEAEWEKAACVPPRQTTQSSFPWGDDSPSVSMANLFENELWGVAPIGSFPEGQSSHGCYQMIGDVWEWTTSDYVPYPGFKPEFDEYNDKWFVGQKVLRGGSYATPQYHIRSTYRNFFHPNERWMISGFRCAKTI
ncbi:MAG TPA: ergothioneine biosynthesis protein EgtB [Blastocatellia bacterium]|nr:ergothioneine biosynthesis protein EgtB [Blastocatellia bacterium]